MKIKYLNTDEYEKWDNYVTLHEKGTIFHKATWLKQHIGEFKILTIQEDSKIMGGFAYLVSKKAGIKGVFRPSYTPYYHPIINEFSEDCNSEKEIEILLMLLNQIKKQNVSLIFDSKTKYFYPYQKAGFKVKPKLNYIIKPSLFLNSITKRKRTSINRYEKLFESGGLKVVVDNDANELLSMWEDFGKEKSINTYIPLLKNLFLKDLINNYWGCVKIYSKDNRLLTVGLFLFDEKKLYNMIPIVNYKILEKKEKNIGDYLYYKLVEIAKEKDLLFDFEGSEIYGVEKMYRRLGGKLDLKYTATNFNLRLNILYSLLNIYKNIKSD